MWTLKLSRKKEPASLLLFFISKSPGGKAIYCRNARVLEMQNFTPAYMKGWTYVRTYSVRTIFSAPKFLGCIVYQIFLPMVLRIACESSAINKGPGTGIISPRIPLLLQAYPPKSTSKLSNSPPTNKLISYTRQLEILATALSSGVCSRSLIETEGRKGILVQN